MSETITRALVLAPSQIRHLLRVTEATSRHPERDAVILLLGLTCGMRITEIAQVTVADLMFTSGKLRHEVSLRAAITKGCQQRSVFLSSPKLITALEGGMWTWIKTYFVRPLSMRYSMHSNSCP